MKKPLTPLVKNGGYSASKDYTPLVYPGGKTTGTVTGANESGAAKENSESENKANGES